MYETNDDLVLNFEPPGVREQDISLSITGDVLTVKGERQFNQQLNDDKYFHTERAYGKFERSIRLPMPVQAGRVRATYRDGMLESKPSGGRGGQAEGNQDRRFVGRSRQVGETVIVADDARKVGSRPAVGRLPMDSHTARRCCKTRLEGGCVAGAAPASLTVVPIAWLTEYSLSCRLPPENDQATFP